LIVDNAELLSSSDDLLQSYGMTGLHVRFECLSSFGFLHSYFRYISVLLAVPYFCYCYSVFG
jgi:hypothetical protein